MLQQLLHHLALRHPCRELVEEWPEVVEAEGAQFLVTESIQEALAQQSHHAHALLNVPGVEYCTSYTQRRSL
jgi:hypothetical protein